jgi:hypothetical protein
MWSRRLWTAMCVAVVVCGVSISGAAAEELVDTVATTRPRAELSEFLAKPAAAAAAKRDYPRAIVLYQALATARGPGSEEARQLAQMWNLAAQNEEASRVYEAFAAATADAEARAAAHAEAQRLSAPDPFRKDLILPTLDKEAKIAFKLGRAAFAKKAWGDALVYFHMGYVLAPDLPGFLRELGATYDKLDARDKKIDFYRAYLQRRPFGKNADLVRAELGHDQASLGRLDVSSALPCEEVWINRQRMPGKLPQKGLVVAPGRYKAMCLSRKYEIAVFEYATVAAGQTANLRFDWAVVRNELSAPLGRIAIENPNAAGSLLDLGVTSPEVGVVVPADGRPLKMVLKDDSGTRVEERSVRIRPGERYVVKW